MENLRNNLTHQRATVSLVVENQHLKDKFSRTQAKLYQYQGYLEKVKGENMKLKREFVELNFKKEEQQKELEGKLAQALQKLETLTSVFRFTAREEAKAICDRVDPDTIILDK